MMSNRIDVSELLDILYEGGKIVRKVSFGGGTISNVVYDRKGVYIGHIWGETFNELFKSNQLREAKTPYKHSDGSTVYTYEYYKKVDTRRISRLFDKK